MPNDYIDQVKLSDSSIVDIKDTVSGYTAPLISTTSNTTPSQVLTAIQAGKSVYITHTHATYGVLAATYFDYSAANNMVVSNIITNGGWVFALIGNTSTNEWSVSLVTIPLSISDLGGQPLITVSGILAGDGAGNVTAAVAGTDYQAPITFDGTYNASTNKAATVLTVTDKIGALDGVITGSPGATKTLTSFSQTDGKVSATFSDITFPVTSVNTKTGVVSLSASDVGALAKSDLPSSSSLLKGDNTNGISAATAGTDYGGIIRRWT